MIGSKPTVKISVSVLAEHAELLRAHPRGASAAMREAIEAWVKRRR